MQQEAKFQEKKDASYELFVLVITLLATINVVIILFTPNEEMDEVLHIMNVGLSIIFMGDFFYRLFTAPNKKVYLFKQWGWADFLGSLPFLGMQVLRLFRVFRIIRLLVEFGKSALSAEIRRNRAGSALASASLLVILVLQFGSYFIVGIESKSPQANIETPFDALWWSVVTIATVGYGDQYPVTVQGRLIGTLVILSGVILFTVFTGFLAKKFFSSNETDVDDPVKSELKLESVHNMIEEQAVAIAALQEQLNRIEDQISPE